MANKILTKDGLSYFWAKIKGHLTANYVTKAEFEERLSSVNFGFASGEADMATTDYAAAVTALENRINGVE